VLFGDVNPSAKLPMTFPMADRDLPHPELVKPPKASQLDFSALGATMTIETIFQAMAKGLPPFAVHYDEGLKVGYKWYDSEHKPVLYPFGYGLSYTTYSYSALQASPDGASVTFTVTNTGRRPGTEIAEVYAALPPAANEPPKRLVGFTRVELTPGQSQQVTVPIDPSYLMVYQEDGPENGHWKRVPGSYTLMVGGSSQELPLKQAVTLSAQ
jgi:beta-glucosidase